MRTAVFTKVTSFLGSLLYAPVKHGSDYRPDVDGLRAIAVLAVVAFHAFPARLSGGFVGVDVFFVISGFLITGIIYKGLRSNKFSFLDFWARRIRRIFPSLLVVIVATFVAGWWYLLPAEFEVLKSHIKWGLAFLANIKLNSEVGYFDTAAELKPLLHLWSLAIEEQFYLVWPALLWFSFRKKLNLFTVTLVLAVVSYKSRKHFGQTPSDIFYFPWTRFWELQLGALLAIWNEDYAAKFENLFAKVEQRVRPPIMHDTETSVTPLVKSALAAVGFVLIVYACTKFSKATPFPSKLTLFPVVGAVLMIAAGKDAWLNRNLLSLRIMRFVGVISFPLYLWHWPILSYLRIILGEPGTKIVLAAVAASFILAAFTYYTVEKFLRFELGRIHWRAPALAAALCGLVIFVKYARMDGNYTAAQAAQVHSAFTSEPCPKVLTTKGLTNLSYCAVSTKGIPKIAIVGDSHANHLFPGLAKNYKEPVLLAGQTSCPPVLVDSFFATDCVVKNKAMLEFFASSQASEVHTVLLSFFYGYAHEIPFAQQHVPPGFWEDITINGSNKRAIKEPAFEKGLASFALGIAKTGKRVFIVRDIPEMPFLPGPCLATIPSRERLMRMLRIEPACTIPFSVYTNRQNDFHRMYERIASQHPNIGILDAAEPLCNGQRCSILVDGKLAYRDSHHLNEYGSEAVSKAIIQKMGMPVIKPANATYGTRINGSL